MTCTGTGKDLLSLGRSTLTSCYLYRCVPQLLYVAICYSRSTLLYRHHRAFPNERFHQNISSFNQQRRLELLLNGSIKETLFKFPTLTKSNANNSARIFLFGDDVNQKVSLCYDVNEDEWSQKKLGDTQAHKFY